ncbi:MAG: MBL fold metallo-hydrolase [Oscillospiraceae bacterium]|nr:MBL fold metallo-hydrolase [Oscillospiraceae bacterium]
MAYEVVIMRDNVWRIEDGGVRSYLFAGGERALLVDTGFGTGDLKSAAAGLTSLPLTLVNTHADGDHIGCNHQFETAYLYPAEFEYYAQSERASENAKPLPLWESDIIDLGGGSFRFEVIHIPGHTWGSIALLDRVNKILVSGDSVSEGAVFMFGPVRSLRAHIASMEKLLARAGDIDAIYPAHGPTPIGAASIEKLRGAGVKLLRGELPALEPPFDIPAKMYMDAGHGFFY